MSSKKTPRGPSFHGIACTSPCTRKSLEPPVDTPELSHTGVCNPSLSTLQKNMDIQLTSRTDWSLDVIKEDDFLASPIFDPVYGFGGNGAYIADVSNLTQTSGVPVPGRSGGGCITDGPFANLTVNMGGASTAYTPHCLRRDVAPEFSMRVCSAAEVNWTLTADTFATFDMSVEALNLTLDGTTTHSCGHWGVGGQVGEVSFSF